MKRLLTLAAVLLCAATAFANPEMTADLPGGATMDFVWIEPGTFLMGTSDEQEQALRLANLWNEFENYNEKPQHQVTLTRGFWLGTYELTQAQWEAVMGTRPWVGHADVQEGPQYPAVFISWDDLQEFTFKLNQAAGGVLYRLPTEAEWEYACRAGTTTLWSFGDDVGRLEDYAWSWENTVPVDQPHAQPVGLKLPNPWGLHDMHGNFLVRRGGTYAHGPNDLRSAYRLADWSDHRTVVTGARLLSTGPAPSAVVPQTWGQVKVETR
jgi:formylglycine-generating enzyme required for sulfatase activity